MAPHPPSRSATAAHNWTTTPKKEYVYTPKKSSAFPRGKGIYLSGRGGRHSAELHFYNQRVRSDLGNFLSSFILRRNSLPFFSQTGFLSPQNGSERKKKKRNGKTDSAKKRGGKIVHAVIPKGNSRYALAYLRNSCGPGLFGSGETSAVTGSDLR